MNEALKSQLLNEAVRIGDELLRRAEPDESGFFWKSMFVDYKSSPKQVVWRPSADVYSGVSGIVLFLLELYRQTKAEAYRQTAVSAMQWVEQYCQDNPTQYYAFFTGRMGVAYTMLRLGDVTGNPDYVQKALAMARPCANSLNSPGTINDLLNGSAGTLLALLHLHAATGQKWLLEAIDLFVGHLLRQAHYGPVGLYWGHNWHQIRGLCGFSHGAAGVGFVFLELAHYFQNEAFLWPAEQAFLYESHFFDAGRKNWPDFRKGIYRPVDYDEHEQAFLAGDLDFFTEPRYMSAWCHGAAGIGLSRLRAFTLTGKELYAEEAEVAIEKNSAAALEMHPESVPSFTLCHGMGGNAELFLEAYRVFNDEEYLSPTIKTAETALALKQANKIYLSGYQLEETDEEDNSLFMGNAGIGYFFLRLIAPHRVPSILSPRVSSVCQADRSAMTYVNISPVAIRKMIAEKAFKRTLYLLDNQKPDKVKAHFERLASSGNRSSFKDTFIDFVETAVATLPSEKQRRLLDVFTLERTKLAMDEAIQSWARLHIKELVQTERAKTLATYEQEAFMALRLILDPETTIVLTAWDWSSLLPVGWVNNLALEPQSYPLLLKPVISGIDEIELTPLTYTMLSAFRNENCVGRVVQETIAAFELDSDDMAAIAEETVLQQVKEALSAGILVEA
jgi:hypothetical protein